MDNTVLMILLIALILCVVICTILAVRAVSAFVRKENENTRSESEKLNLETLKIAEKTTEQVRSDGEQTMRSMKMMADIQDKRLNDMSKRINEMSLQNELKLDNIRTTLEKRLASMQDENKVQLEKMRDTVDEKLQKTLEERISKSFRMVNEQLDLVSKGFGEMQALASNVGDLKKVLANVKTRGNLGEIQLGAILAEIMAPEQYDENVVTKKKGAAHVEFAVKLPGEGDDPVYLPIDSKFPGDTYEKLLDAYESGDKLLVDSAKKELIKVLKLEAKDIREKYIEPPATTDFAVMFLPVEGLYAEAVRLGMVEELQGSDYKVNIAGPTTMAALLNSLQMGFRTLAIRKHSSEVWDTLAGVKAEFAKFENVLAKVRNNLSQADKNLETLVGTRTRQINRKLRNVEMIDNPDGIDFLDDAEDEFGEDTE